MLEIYRWMGGWVWTSGRVERAFGDYSELRFTLEKEGEREK